MMTKNISLNALRKFVINLKTNIRINIKTSTKISIGILCLLNCYENTIAQVTIDDSPGSSAVFTNKITQSQRGPIEKELFGYSISTDGGAQGTPDYTINITTTSNYADSTKGPYLQLSSSTAGYNNVPAEHRKLYVQASYRSCFSGQQGDFPLFQNITSSNSAQFNSSITLGQEYTKNSSCDPSFGAFPGAIKFTIPMIDGFTPAAGVYTGTLSLSVNDNAAVSTPVVKQFAISAEVSTIMNVPNITITNLGDITISNQNISHTMDDYNYNITSNAPNGIRITASSPFSDETGAYISKSSITNPNQNQRIHFQAFYTSCNDFHASTKQNLTQANQTIVQTGQLGFVNTFDKYCTIGLSYIPGHLSFTRLAIPGDIPEAGSYSGNFTITATAV